MAMRFSLAPKMSDYYDTIINLLKFERYGNYIRAVYNDHVICKHSSNTDDKHYHYAPERLVKMYEAVRPEGDSGFLSLRQILEEIDNATRTP